MLSSLPIKLVEFKPRSLSTQQHILSYLRQLEREIVQIICLLSSLTIAITRVGLVSVAMKISRQVLYHNTGCDFVVTITTLAISCFVMLHTIETHTCTYYALVLLHIHAHYVLTHVHTYTLPVYVQFHW